MRLFATTLALAVAAVAALGGDRETLVRDAVDNYFRSARLMQQFAVIRQTERRDFQNNGDLKTRDHWTQRIDFIDGVRVGWTIERDGKPVSEEERMRSYASARQAAAEWKAKPPAERKKQLEKAEKETDYLREFPNALAFTALPDEVVNGRMAMVWSFNPKPGYKAKTMGGRIYEGVTGRIWLDREERQLVRLDAEVTKEVTIGGFLAKIEKGTRFELTQTRMESGCWLPSHQLVNYGARILMVKGIHRSVDTHYRQWRRSAGPIWSGN
ncbi:MAG TPA: hypothetical protein PKJ41_08085 [Bryobacteraceae bacterium]|mgnify:CR=1 FL=1|nr:hypothetical protein [Bryobacteraceae bacterium]HPT26016.1 hypothetical protein [Bryobacteraceae bacterium]